MLSRLVPVIAVLALGSPAVGAEPWADKRLPDSSREGLMLWLDAQAQPAARKEQKRPELSLAPMADVWFDASGHQRHATQPSEDRRPMFRGSSFLFDGDNDVMLFAGPAVEFRAITLFAVVSPVSNMGDFRGIVAAHDPRKNDYTSGINVDQGPAFSTRWETVNAEGAGFGGARSLLDTPVKFGAFHLVALTCEPGPEGVRLHFDGRSAGKRPRTESRLRLDHLAIGARLYNNAGGKPEPTGFFDGDIAEILVYDRALNDQERKRVESYLTQKYREIVPEPVARAGAPGAKPLVPVTDPPPVQMFIPGYAVRQLPLDLTNINNVRCRPDGKLLAVAYDGNIYLLEDTDGDGLEDKATKFWTNKGEIRAPIGACLTPPGYKHGNGIFVACRGKVSLIVDTDGDDIADKEIVVASGWKELWVAVDALGVAVAADGSVYFGLGTPDFSNGYQIDKDGKAQFDIKGVHGTIQKVSPDFKKRETVCTGIRFPVGLAFNRQGDLFASDQEGATWLPNGNPLDELLHIQPGRHYGFPPRHPKHLPNVIDEPSTFDWGPQHQSICGLMFNDPVVDGGPTFGPAAWAGNIIAAGESRGKLYRVQLTKTPAGYVARNQLFASLSMLTIDCCVSKRGDLVVCCHSGPPDWGTGPAGKGKLFKIMPVQSDVPQPLAVWPAGPGEVRVAFDKPLDPARLENLARRTSIERGAYVRAGDRFEAIRPGYAVVQQQMRAPRFAVPVLAASVSPDRRTLIFSTPPTNPAQHYALSIDGWDARGGKGALPQHAPLDLGYDLSGVLADWHGDDGSRWIGWLPHLDLAVSREFLGASPEHAEFWKNLGKPGKLTLRTKLNLWQMLHPAIQPGARIDWVRPQEQVRIALTGKQLTAVRLTDHGVPVVNGYAAFERAAIEDKPVALEVDLATGAAPELQVAFSTNEDSRFRPLQLHRFLLPWAELKSEAGVERTEIPELKGGNWHRGREVFFGEQAQCSKCHMVNGAGKDVGPNLSNLIHRDYDSVLRDIRTPSATINPDHLTAVIELKNGRTLAGVIRRSGDRTVVVDGGGGEHPFDPNEVETLTHSPASLMPDGIDKVLGPEKMRDLLTFLLTEPLRPAPLEHRGEPPPRSRAEVEDVLKASPMPEGPFRKVHVVLSSGPKDHGPGEHDYPLWRRRWVQLFDLAPNVTVSECDGFPKPELLARADVVVFYSNNPGWNAETARQLDAYLTRGGGAVFIHYAVDGHRHADELATMIGLAWKGGASKFRHGPLELSFADKLHPISRGLTKLKLIDESYWQLTGDPANVVLLGAGTEDGKPQPLLWARPHGKGRVFVSIPGHYTWSFDDPLFRLLLLRGIAWSAKEPPDRWRELIWPGARVTVQ